MCKKSKAKYEKERPQEEIKVEQFFFFHLLQNTDL